MALLEYLPPTDPWTEIVYQDEHILVANKPAGLLSVPGRLAEHYDSIWSRLRESYPNIEVVHRLDMATSGLMLFALTKEAERHIKSSSNIVSPIKFIMHAYGDMLNKTKVKSIYR